MYRCGVFKQNRLEYICYTPYQPILESSLYCNADKGDSKTYYVTNLRETKVFKWEISIRTVVSDNFQSTILWKTSCFSKKKLNKKKKDRDPAISAVTNIHTRFFIQIREYPSTPILAAALVAMEYLEKLHLGQHGCWGASVVWIRVQTLLYVWLEGKTMREPPFLGQLCNGRKALTLTN